MKCKFCGNEIKDIPVFKHARATSCSDCNSFCNQKCDKHKDGMLSWHQEPCVSCEHNPYKKAYIWEDGKWTKKN